MSSNQLTKILKAIADPTRREIFHMLVAASTAMSITQIATQFDISRQGLTKHIKQLETAGLVYIKPDGRERYCKANGKPLETIDTWIKSYSQFWDRSLDDLGKHLQKRRK